MRRFDAALAETAIAEGKAPDWSVLVAARGFTYAMAGMTSEAQAVLREMGTLARHAGRAGACPASARWLGVHLDGRRKAGPSPASGAQRFRWGGDRRARLRGPAHDAFGADCGTRPGQCGLSSAAPTQ